MIVRTILRLAESLNIDVIAEGAETLGELQALLSIGCQTVQGYGIAQPMPAEAMHEWLGLFARKMTTEKLKLLAQNDTENVVKLA